MSARLENLCAECHFTAVDTGRASATIGSAVEFIARCLPRNAQKFRPETRATRSIVMLDVLMLVLGFGLFVLGIGYAHACERL